MYKNSEGSTDNDNRKFSSLKKSLDNENRIMRCSGYMHKVQKYTARKDRLMKPAGDANK